MNDLLPRRPNPERLALWVAVLGVALCRPGPARLALAADGAAVRALQVHPESVELRGPHAAQRLVIWAELEDGSILDVTTRASVKTQDAAVAELSPIDDEERPAIRPRGDGATRIVVRWKDREAAIAVKVQDFDSDAPPRFTHDVIARMTRASCNSGSCHGAQHGQGDLNLSLLGYVPQDDYKAIAKSKDERRVRTDEPDRSRILQKPLQEVPHEGGRRFEKGSRMHSTLRRWIAAGAPGPSGDDVTVVGLSVFPPQRILSPGQSIHFLATAHLSDGAREDVTGRALLSSLNDGIASVDDAARVTAVSSGETAIMVRYQGQSTIVRVTVPYRELAGTDSFEPRNFIDEHAARKWRTLGLSPSPECTDAEFIRRVFLSVIGTLPEPEEVRKFLADDSPDKRDALIDAVLERPEYVDYWALKWGDLLRISRDTMNEKGMWSLHNWVREQLRKNRPLDAMVSALITAQGSTYTSGPTNFYRAAQKPKDLAETTAQVFLGLRLQCAQCHHHPFEKWTQTDYWGLAAYFARLGIKSSSEFGVYGREQVVYVKKGGEVKHPKTGKVVPPKPLDAPPSDDPVDRRRALAAWLTSNDNRLFARNLANRLWGYVVGRGIVEPIDDLRVTNPPSNPALLDALADRLVELEFDAKGLLRDILRSRVFQLSSRPTELNAGDAVFFSHFPVERLSAEVLHDAICAATEIPESFKGLPAGTRAIELPDPEFNSYFLTSFGKPKRAIACECERVGKPNMAQALHLINGAFVQKRVDSGKGRVARAAKSDRPDAEIVDEFYLATFSRFPSKAERERATEFIAQAPDREEGLEDLLWALCNAKEFLFNH